MFANWYRELQTMIDEGYYYVDKTLFIKEVLNEKSHCTQDRVGFTE